ncbi:hypothetical protein VPH35_082629 [Triticum aestivum]
MLFLWYSEVKALRFRLTTVYTWMGLAVSSHLIYGWRLLSPLFNTKYIIRLARFLFVFVSQAAKNVLAAVAATSSVPAFRAPYCKYTFWIRVHPSRRRHHPRTVARCAGDTDEVEQYVPSSSSLGVWDRG